MTRTAVVDLRLYHPRERLAWIEMTLAHLGPDEDMVIVLEHEPVRLATHLAERYGDMVRLETEESGPEVWRYRLIPQPG